MTTTVFTTTVIHSHFWNRVPESCRTSETQCLRRRTEIQRNRSTSHRQPYFWPVTDSNIHEPNQFDKDPLPYLRHLALLYKTISQFLFPYTIQQWKTFCLTREPSLALCYREKLLLATSTSEFAICAKSALRCQEVNPIPTSTLHRKQCRVNTEVELNHIIGTLIPQPRKHRIQRRSLPELRTATTRPNYIKCEIHHFVCFGFLRVRVDSAPSSI